MLCVYRTPLGRRAVRLKLERFPSSAALAEGHAGTGGTPSSDGAMGRPPNTATARNMVGQSNPPAAHARPERQEASPLSPAVEAEVGRRNPSQHAAVPPPPPVPPEIPMQESQNRVLGLAPGTNLGESAKAEREGRDDDRRTCHQCGRLEDGFCVVARPGGLVSARWRYRPEPDVLQRCGGYQPTAEDSDQRSANERWQGMANKKNSCG